MKNLWIGVAAIAVLAVLIKHPTAPGAAPIVTAATTLAPRAPHKMRVQEAVVYVAGAIAHPGLYRLPYGSRADDAVRRAGGFLSSADQAGVNLAAPIDDGDEIRVPRIGERAVRAPSTKRRRSAKRTVHPAALDLNAAGADAFESLPGIGAALAQRIVAFRDVNGPFSSVDELLDVAGMTQRRLDAIAPYLSVHGAP